MTRTESPAEDLFLAGFVEAFARRHDRQDLHVHRGNVSLVHPCSLVGGPNPDVPAACVEDLRLDHEMSAAWIGLAWRKEQRPFALFSQVKAEESRLDFLLALSGYSPTNPFPTFVAVEIDGWTYHGRDDEQAIARDHLRDVALLTSFGVPTVRLMASMLRAQPAECGDRSLAVLWSMPRGAVSLPRRRWRQAVDG